MSKFNSLNAKKITSNNWVIHSEQTLGSAVSSVTISNLNGDVDGEYRIIIRSYDPVGQNYFLRFNGDAGTNYGLQTLSGTNTTAGCFRTPTSGVYFHANGNNYALADIAIQAKSGYLRTALARSAENVSGTTVTAAYMYACSWTNTADNITSAAIVTSGGNALGIGTYILVLKKVEVTTTASEYNSVSVPMGKLTADTFETIAEGTLGASASTITVSGLNGDSDVIYEVEVMALAQAASTSIALLPNNATTNIGYQYLQGNGASASAARNFGTPGMLSNFTTFTTGAVGSAKFLLYAKTGFLRPAISESATGITTTTVLYNTITGHSWNETVTNITSLVISAVSGNFDIGTYYRVKTLKRKV